MQSAQVSIKVTSHCLSAHCHSIQPLGGLDHPPVIDSAGPYPAMNYDYANPLRQGTLVLWGMTTRLIWLL
jgi:hypothetical protein